MRSCYHWSEVLEKIHKFSFIHINILKIMSIFNLQSPVPTYLEALDMRITTSLRPV